MWWTSYNYTVHVSQFQSVICSACIGCFYFLLGNIHPKYRSTVDSIQLLALAKHSLITEYGIDKILEPILQDLKKLEEVNACKTCTQLYCCHISGFACYFFIIGCCLWDL